MKKKLVILGYLILLTVLGFFIKENMMLKYSINEKETKTEVVKEENMLSMMIEQTAGAGDYKQETRNSWPTDGYVFNTTLSKCENGGELSWGDTNKAVLMIGTGSDRYFVYFDIMPSVLLANYIISQYNGVQGNNNIYYHDSSLTNGAGDNSYRYAGGGYKRTNTGLQ